MNPKKFWNEFRLPKWKDEIFVGMWFDETNIKKRYDNIVKKAIEDVRFKPRLLKDVITGDSIPTDIMTGIIECKVVLFDISAIDEAGKVRNPNVMYELGLAHTWRNREEVIVIWDGNGSLPFDIQSMGVIQYDIKHEKESIEIIKRTILFRIQEIEKTQKSIVRKSAESLNIQAHNVLMGSQGVIFHDANFPDADRMLAIPVLLNLGLIEMLTDRKGFGYHPTQLGREVIKYYDMPVKPDDLKDTYKTLYKEEY